VSVLAHLERLDHRVAGSPETEYVFEARKFRLRLALVVLLTLLSLVIALLSNVRVAGWLLVAFAVATGVKNYLALQQFKAAAAAAQRAGRWYER